MGSVGFLNAIYYKDNVLQGRVQLSIPISGDALIDHYNGTFNQAQVNHGFGGLLLLGCKAFYNSSAHQAPYGYDVYAINNADIATVDDLRGHVLKFVVDEDNDVYFTMSFNQNVWNSSDHTIYIEYAFYRGNTHKCTLSRPVSSQDFYYGGLNHNSASVISIPWTNPTDDYLIWVGGRMFGTFNQNSYDIETGSDWSTFRVDHDTTFLSSFIEWRTGIEPIIKDDDNPYWEGGTSEEGGGGGNFSDDSDTVDEDQLPTIDAVGTGFATLFTPSKSQLKYLADVMWDNGIFQTLQNLVENISNMFTSLAIVPFVVTPGNTVSVDFLGLFSTGISLTLAAQQYFEFDMGAINMASDSRIYTSGSALDYSPFSKLGIFLPFIGFQDLDIDECRDATIGLKYRIDILSGTCVALISVNGNPIYQFSGNCLSQIPITNENMQSLVTDAVNVGIAATASHAASGAVSSAESMLGEAQQAGRGVKTAETQLAHAEARKAITRGQLASATANASMGMKPSFGKAGSISASASLLAVKQPYLFLTTPRQSIPEHYQRYCGFPSNISGKLSEFSGYTVVEDIRLNGLVATSPEVAEIYELLKSGVII